MLDADGCGSCGRGLRLQDRFLDALGRMSEATQKDAVRHKVYSAQFHMGFEEESLAVERNLEELRDLSVVFIGMNARGQNHEVGGNHDRHSQRLVVDGDIESLDTL